MLQEFAFFSGAQRKFPHTGVSWFLQPNRNVSRSSASNLCKPLRIMSHYSTSFYLLFGIPFFVPSTSKCSAFTGPFFSSILSTCPYHRRLCSLRNSSNLSTPVILRIFSLFVLSFKVFPHIIHKVLISVVFIFFSSSTFNAQHSALQVKALLTYLLHNVSLTFKDMLLPHITFKASLKFFLADRILDVIAS